MAERRIHRLLVADLAADIAGSATACAHAIHAPPLLLRPQTAAMQEWKTN